MLLYVSVWRESPASVKERLTVNFHYFTVSNFSYASSQNTGQNLILYHVLDIQIVFTKFFE